MESASIHAEWVGRVVDGKFSLLQWLGPSDSGGVFLAELDGLPWKQANVELIPADAEKAEALAAAWALAAPLSHPHLIRLIDSGRCAIDTSFLIYAVTEHPEEVLSEILPQRPLTPTEVGETLAPIVDALAYLHGNGIVHGHLKPANILVVGDRVKLSSRWLYAAGKPVWHSAARDIYDAPETSSEPISAAADIWSLGVTLVEALTQYPIWDRSTEGEPIVPAAIPEPFHTIAQECLRTDPARRCTLSDIKARLQPLASVKAPMEPVRTERIQNPPVAKTPISIAIPARYRGPAILAAALFLIALAVTLVVHFHHAEPTSMNASQPPLPAVPAPQPSASTVTPPSSGAAPAPSASPVPTPDAVPAPQTDAPMPENQSSRKSAAADQVIERAMPDLLPSAVRTIHGEVSVKVRVTVDPSGNVESATLDSPGPSKYFAKMSLQAAQSWKFKPTQDPSTWTLHFKFKQSGTDVTPVQVSP